MPLLRNPAVRALIACTVSIALCVLGLTGILRLWEADLSIPFNDRGDAVLTGMWIRSIRENGWHLVNPRLGAPGLLVYYDFPFGDTLHFLLLKVFSWFTPHFGLVQNL